MKVCRFATRSGAPGLGLVEADEILDLSAAGLAPEPAAALAEVGRDGLEKLADGAPRLPLAGTRLLAPAIPRKYLAIALNYADHIAEMGMEAPEVPVFFNKQVDLRDRARRRGAHAQASPPCSTTRASWRWWSASAAATSRSSAPTR